MKKLILTWQDVEHGVASIARQISLSDWHPDLIIGVDRGGLPVSTMLSHYLNVNHETVKVSLRDGGSKESLLWAPEDVIEGKRILIVDDINDSGATQTWIRNDWASSVAGVMPDFDLSNWHINVRWASLVENSASKEHSDYYGVEINKAEDDVWVDFPWESWWSRKT